MLHKVNISVSLLVYTICRFLQLSFLTLAAVAVLLHYILKLNFLLIIINLFVIGEANTLIFGFRNPEMIVWLQLSGKVNPDNNKKKSCVCWTCLVAQTSGVSIKPVTSPIWRLIATHSGKYLKKRPPVRWLDGVNLAADSLMTSGKTLLTQYLIKKLMLFNQESIKVIPWKIN